MSRLADSPRLRASLIAGAIALAALAYRLPHMGRSFWLDEIFSVRVARVDLEELSGWAGRDVHPPLYYFLLHFWNSVGEDEAWVRLPSLLCGLGLVALLGFLVKEMAGPRAGWLASAFSAVAYPLCWISYEARSFALMNLFALGAWWFLVTTRTRGGGWRWAGVGLCMAGAAYCFYYAFFAIAALGVFFLFLRPGAREWRGFIGACLLALLLYLPWLPSFQEQLERAMQSRPGGWGEISGPWPVIKHHFVRLGPWRALSWGGLILFVAILAFARSGKTEGESRTLQRATAASTLALAVLLTGTEIALGYGSYRYSTFLCAAWIAWWAMALTRLPRRRWAGVLTAVLLVACARHSWRKSIHPPSPNWEAIVTHIDEVRRERDGVGSLQFTIGPPYTHYHLPGKRAPASLFVIRREDTDERWRSICRGYDRVFLIWGYKEKERPETRRFLEWLANQGFTLERTRAFRLVTLERYERSGVR